MAASNAEAGTPPADDAGAGAVPDCGSAVVDIPSVSTTLRVSRSGMTLRSSGMPSAGFMLATLPGKKLRTGAGPIGPRTESGAGNTSFISPELSTSV